MEALLFRNVEPLRFVTFDPARGVFLMTSFFAVATVVSAFATGAPCYTLLRFAARSEVDALPFIVGMGNWESATRIVAGTEIGE